MKRKSETGINWLGGLSQWLLALWAVALVFYFEVREGLIRWPWLFAPPAEGFFHKIGVAAPHFEKPLAAQGDVAPYVEILKNLFKPWNVQWGNAPWTELAISLGMILAYTLLGWMLIAAFRIFVPLGARLCLAFTVGMGAVGIAAEGLAMANRLTRPMMAGMWGILLLVGFLIWLYQYQIRDRPQAISTDTRLTPKEQQRGAQDWFRLIYAWPIFRAGKMLYGLYVLLFVLITGFVTLHAIGEPVVYWDSLILYVGYARAIFLEGGFPVKVVGQVGVGLGANYPHLYELLTAQTAALAG